MSDLADLRYQVDLAKRIDFWLERDEVRVNLGRENQRLARRSAHA
jgi:hypothetical protein